MVAMRCDARALVESASTTVSPTRTEPALTVPARPRKSRPSRSTVCTGKRNGPVASVPRLGSSSRCASRCGPLYQGMLPSGSPRCRRRRRRPEWRSPPRSRSARRACGSRPRSGGTVCSDQSTRSILLTTRMTRFTPTRSRIAAWRRVCFLMPWRASTSMMATSACERARGHVARVLLVAGAVDDDEAARVRCRSSARRCRW